MENYQSFLMKAFVQIVKKNDTLEILMTLCFTRTEIAVNGEKVTLIGIEST